MISPPTPENLKMKLTTKTFLETFELIGASSLKDLSVVFERPVAELLPVVKELLDEEILEKHVTNIGGFILRFPIDGSEVVSEQVLDKLMSLADAKDSFTVNSLHTAALGSLRLSKRIVATAVDKLESTGRIQQSGTKTFMGNTYKVFKVV